jgi:hypothetical protein
MGFGRPLIRASNLLRALSLRVHVVNVHKTYTPTHTYTRFTPCDATMSQIGGLSLKHRCGPRSDANAIISPSRASFAFEESFTLLNFTMTATGATRLHVLMPFPAQAILRRAKTAKPDAVKKWAHALALDYPELANKSDEELEKSINCLRAR